MTAECSIVVSDTDPVKVPNLDCENGVLVDFLTLWRSRIKVDKLLNEPQNRERLGRTGRETIVKNYDPRSVVCLKRWLG